MADSPTKKSDTQKAISSGTKTAAAKKPPGRSTAAKSAAKKPAPAGDDTAIDAAKSASASEDRGAYEVVNPPPPISHPRKSGIARLFMGAVVVLLLAGGVYITWPQWSPHVADKFPALAYKPAPNPELARLMDRVNALETEAKGRLETEKSIAEMEQERSRLQDGVKSLLGRLEELEGAVGDVRRMIRTGGNQGDDEETRKSMERISKRLAELEKRGGAIADLAQRMSEIEQAGQKVAGAAIERAEAANRRLNDAVTQIETRLSEVEKARTNVAASGGGVASAAILAISQLRKTVLAGQPFDADVEAVRAVSGRDEGMKAALLTLEARAASGVATLTDLRASFTRAANAIIGAEMQKEGGGWIENAANTLRSFISVRQVDGSAPARSVDSFVLRAEDSLKAGDLNGAVKALEELDAVSPPAATAAAEWLESARARLNAERAVTSLHAYAVSLIAATKE